jgi:histidine triad (HIT) family protein
MTSGCLLCKIARGQIPSHRIHEDELTVAFLDVDQVNPGHVIVAVRPHLETIVDLSPDQATAAFGTVRRVAGAVEAAFKPDGLTIWQSNGPVGWQVIPHFHVHVLPRRANDGVRLTWPRRSPPADELARLAEQIHSAR